MAAAKGKKVNKATRRRRKPPGIVERARREIERRSGAVSKDARAAYREVRSGLKGLEKLVFEVERDLVRTEKKIEADARARIVRLRRDAAAQRRTLERKRREAQRVLTKLSAGADDSWRDVKRAADAIVGEAQRAASAIAKRFRTALKA